MVFTVCFCGTNPSLTLLLDAISMPSRTIGIKDVDFIRDQLYRPSLPLYLINGSIARFSNSAVTIAIDEDTARMTNLFDNRSEVKVLVPDSFLNQFIIEQVYSIRGEKKDAIVEAGLKFSRADHEIIGAWVDAGFPLKWGFDKD